MAESMFYCSSNPNISNKKTRLEIASSYHIVWLDSHICKEGNHLQLKVDFSRELLLTAAVPPFKTDSEIDGALYHIREHGTPITFVDNPDQALEVIGKVSKVKKVIFVTSGRLGKEVIPRIHEEELEVYRYYIFCGAMIDHVGWIMNYVDKGINITTLDFELDLLIRLLRDMCREFIEEGKKLLNVGHATMALKYFEYALLLGDKAYNLDLPKDTQKNGYMPTTEYRRILSSENGLIAQARRCSAP